MTKRIPQLDGLRGLAILAVIATHCFYSEDMSVFQGVFAPLKIATLGWMGVDLFFVLSGFLLGGILTDEKGSEGYFRRFYLRRAARIVPLYYMWLLTCTVLDFVWPSQGFSLNPSIGISYQLLFLQNVVMARHPESLTISWSLAVEEQFYLILPLLIAHIEQRNVRKILIGYLALVPVLRMSLLGFLHMSSSLPLLVSLPTHGDGLAVGVLLSMAVRSERALGYYRQYRTAITFLIAGLALTTGLFLLGRSNGPPVVSYFYLPIALVCGWTVLDAVVRPEAWAGRLGTFGVLRSLGRISYCVYLVHAPAIAAVSNYFASNYFGRETQPLSRYYSSRGLTALVAITISILIAKLSMAFFEGPILKWAHARIRRIDVRQTDPVPRTEAAV